MSRQINVWRVITDFVAKLRAEGRQFPEGIEHDCAALCPAYYDIVNDRQLMTFDQLTDAIYNYIESHEIQPPPNTDSPWYREAP